MKSARPTGLISRKSGTIVVYALIVLAVGAVVLAGWVQLLATRSANVEIKASEVQRRITLENSRLLASQYLLQNVFSGTFSGPVTNSNSWGRFVLAAAVTPSTALNSTNSASSRGAFYTNVNHFSLGSYGGYTLDLTATNYDGTTNVDGRPNSATYLFRARSRSPMLGYDLFTQQDPSISLAVSGNVTAANNVMLWNPALGPYSFVGNTTNTYQAGATNATGPTPLGFALAPMTSWSTNFSGSVRTLDPDPTITINTLWDKGGKGFLVPLNLTNNFSTNGLQVTTNGVVTVDLNTLTWTNKISLSQSTNDYRMRITGNTTTNISTLVIVATNASRLTNIAFTGAANTKRLYLGIRNSPVLTVSGSGTWRLGATFEQSPVTITTTGWQITGGIRADRNFTVSGGALTIAREMDPATMESLLDRVGWLEVYRQ